MRIVQLNAATLPVYCRDLASLLRDAIHSGASVGFQQPLSQEDAERSFYSQRAELDKGTRLLWIARDESGVAATASLLLSPQPDSRNRAEVKLLLVHRRARRNGIGRKLMAEVEQAALARQRGLIHLDIQARSSAEAFYRALNYRRLGELPDYIGSPDGCYHPAVIYYKRLFAVTSGLRAVAS